jgi:hypothetical protein
MAKSTEAQKEYMKKYHRSEKGKASRKRSESKESRKSYLYEFRRSDKNKEIQKEYSSSVNGKLSRKGITDRYRAKYPGKRKARTAVHNAVAAGKMPCIKTLACDCGEQAQHYHHKSYDKANWLNVIPVCNKCHYSLHHIDSV